MSSRFGATCVNQRSFQRIARETSLCPSFLQFANVPATIAREMLRSLVRRIGEARSVRDPRVSEAQGRRGRP
jgi:hypothetical protein